MTETRARILHSPTERGPVITALRNLTQDANVALASSGRVEPKGVDYAWLGAGGEWYGVQRKELRDYVASQRDGRLSREVGQMRAEIHMPVVVLEGTPLYSVDGTGGGMVTIGSGRHSEVTRYRSFVRQALSLKAMGVGVWQTASARQTAETIVAFCLWSLNPHHTTATNRPGPIGDWGKPTNRDWQTHLLQGIDGVGPKMANAILDTLGRCPLVLDATREELMQVPGIGAKTADRILGAVGGAACDAPCDAP